MCAQVKNKMTTLLNTILKNDKLNLAEVLKSGATVIDVRSEKEFSYGNVPNSINIPLQQITNEVEMLKLKQPLVLCCASGMRSSMAVSELKKIGITEVYNGGDWKKVESQSI